MTLSSVVVLAYPRKGAVGGKDSDVANAVVVLSLVVDLSLSFRLGIAKNGILGRVEGKPSFLSSRPRSSKLLDLRHIQSVPKLNLKS